MGVIHSRRSAFKEIYRDLLRCGIFSGAYSGGGGIDGQKNIEKISKKGQDSTPHPSSEFYY